MLPTFDNEGQRFPNSEFERVRRELTDRYGGVTAFVRSPAVGLWTDEAGQIRQDELVTFEVMTDALDRDWWREYRELLQQRFRQQLVARLLLELSLRTPAGLLLHALAILREAHIQRLVDGGRGQHPHLVA